MSLSFLKQLFITAFVVIIIVHVLLFVTNHYSYSLDILISSKTQVASSVLTSFAALRTRKSDGNKIILMWTAMHAVQYDFNPVQQPSWLLNCPDLRCTFSTNRSDLTQADAVFVSMPDLGSIQSLLSIEKRQSSPYFVFYNDESPATTESLVGGWPSWKNLDNFFNLTMTYRSDADIPTELYYEEYVPHLIDPRKRVDSWFQEKRNILWLVSNCRTASKREQYAKQLLNYIEFDQFGRFNDHQSVNCSRKHSCIVDLMKSYKFYFSFENR